jgi:hypothetical protein
VAKRKFPTTAGNWTPVVQPVSQSLYWQSYPGSVEYPHSSSLWNAVSVTLTKHICSCAATLQRDPVHSFVMGQFLWPDISFWFSLSPGGCWYVSSTLATTSCPHILHLLAIISCGEASVTLCLPVCAHPAVVRHQWHCGSFCVHTLLWWGISYIVPPSMDTSCCGEASVTLWVPSMCTLCYGEASVTLCLPPCAHPDVVSHQWHCASLCVHTLLWWGTSDTVLPSMCTICCGETSMKLCLPLRARPAVVRHQWHCASLCVHTLLWWGINDTVPPSVCAPCCGEASVALASLFVHTLLWWGISDTVPPSMCIPCLMTYGGHSTHNVQGIVEAAVQLTEGVTLEGLT